MSLMNEESLYIFNIKRYMNLEKKFEKLANDLLEN